MIRLSLFILLIFGSLFSVGQRMIPPYAHGGETALRELLQNELVYPNSALREGREGTVVLRFIVDEKGQTEKIKIWQSAGADLDQEARRLFNKVLWHPGIYGNLPSASEHYFRVDFNIRKYRKWCRRRGYNSWRTPYPCDPSETLFTLDSLAVQPAMIFPKGITDYNDFLAENLNYPHDALKYSMEGTVVVSFVIETSGRLSNIEIDKQVGGGCGAEAIRLVRLLRWIPGQFDGQAVRTRMYFAVHFQLPDGDIPRNLGSAQ